MKFEDRKSSESRVNEANYPVDVYITLHMKICEIIANDICLII
jgi:hypothetical protein